MNTGQATDLVQEILQDNANMFPDWASFKAWFLSKSMYLDKAQCAALMLEGISYHQQGHTLDAYIDGFKQLVQCSGLLRSAQLVLYFNMGSTYQSASGLIV